MDQIGYQITLNGLAVYFREYILLDIRLLMSYENWINLTSVSNTVDVG